MLSILQIQIQFSVYTNPLCFSVNIYTSSHWVTILTISSQFKTNSFWRQISAIVIIAFHHFSFTGNYIAGVLKFANKCMYNYGSVWLYGNLLTLLYLPRISLPAIKFLSNVCSFLVPEIQSVLNRSLLIPAHQNIALGTNKCLRGFS